MPTEVSIHDFADTSKNVVDGPPARAMTWAQRQWVSLSARWYQSDISHLDDVLWLVLVMFQGSRKAFAGAQARDPAHDAGLWLHRR
jgi:hypothetical protein